MTYDPQIKPSIAIAYHVEGPPRLLARYADRRQVVWFHQNGDRAVIIAKEPTKFKYCNVESNETVDYNQTVDYNPRAWIAWCNAKRPIYTMPEEILPKTSREHFASGRADKLLERLGRIKISSRSGQVFLLSSFQGIPKLRRLA